MSGAGIGGALGTAAGLALAPETGGASLLVPALGGAAGSALGGSLTGDKNVGRDALAGGIGGAIPGVGNASGLTSGLSGLLGNAGANGVIQGLGGALSGGVASGNARDALLSGLVAGATGYGMTPGAFGGDSSAVPGSTESDFNNVMSGLDKVANGPGIQSADPSASMAGEPNASAAPVSSPGLLSRLASAAAKNPLNTALAGSLGLSAIQSLLPKKSVNVAGNANSVLSTNPNFTNPNLPAYHMQNSYVPYTGNWYTYGQQPESPMVSSQAVPGAKAGGLIKGYAHGGPVGCYADGGNVLPPAMPQAPQGMVPSSANPGHNIAAFKLGHAIGSHLRQNGMFTGIGQVRGAGAGQDDLIPAKLSRDEFVVPSDVVSHLGDGSSDAGGERLKGFIHNVRTHKSGSGFPPKAKNPLAYLPRGGV